MSIVSSVIAEDHAQADGRRWIRERHTDQLGLLYEFAYMAAAADNATTIMNNRVASINADLIATEIAANVYQATTFGSLAVTTRNYSTVAANAAAFREAYHNATGNQAVMIGDLLSTLTDGQLQTAFGLTAGQVTTLRTNKLSPAAATAAEIRSAVGQ